MSILIQCYKCGEMYGTTPGSGKLNCDECDGTNEYKRKELERWKNLSLEEKVEELKIRVDSLGNSHLNFF